MLLRDAITLPLWMKRWVARTRVIDTLLFTYPQVHEDGFFHFCVRCLAMHLSITSALTPRRPSTETTKGVKRLHLFKQALCKVPCALRFGIPPTGGGEETGGGRCKNTGQDPLFTRRSGGPRRLPTEYGSC